MGGLAIANGGLVKRRSPSTGDKRREQATGAYRSNCTCGRGLAATAGGSEVKDAVGSEPLRVAGGVGVQKADCAALRVREDALLAKKRKAEPLALCIKTEPHPSNAWPLLDAVASVNPPLSSLHTAATM